MRSSDACAMKRKGRHHRRPSIAFTYAENARFAGQGHRRAAVPLGMPCRVQKSRSRSIHLARHESGARA